MCNIPSPNPRPLIIEVFDTGKVSLATFLCSGENQFTIEELKKCRDYIDLIIANPDNFHVVKPEIKIRQHDLICGMPPIPSMRIWCKQCEQPCNSEIERGNNLCHDCERKQLIYSANKPFDKEAFLKLNSISACTPVEGRPVKNCPFCKTEINYTPAYNRGWCMVCVGGDEHTQAEYDDLTLGTKIEEVTSPFVDAINGVEIDKPEPLDWSDSAIMDKPNFVCDQCGENFISRTQLKNHKCPTFS